MSEYEDVLEEVLTEGEVPESEEPAPLSVSTTPAERVPPDVASRGGALPDPKLKREKRKIGTAGGRCPMYAPRGTRCPACGKVHPL